MRCGEWNKHVLLDCFDDWPVHPEGAKRVQSIVLEELCYPATVRMAVALRQALSWCTFAARALRVHQPVIGCFRWHHAAAQRSLSLSSDKVELNSFETEYDPKTSSCTCQ